jgi:hypothetical protein
MERHVKTEEREMYTLYIAGVCREEVWNIVDILVAVHLNEERGEGLQKQIKEKVGCGVVLRYD